MLIVLAANSSDDRLQDPVRIVLRRLAAMPLPVVRPMRALISWMAAISG